MVGFLGYKGNSSRSRSFTFAPSVMHLGSILCEASKEEEYSELESQVKF